MTYPPVICDYLFSTFPSRLQVSTATASSSGRIDLSVSNGGSEKFCKQIMVAVPIGTEAIDFSDQEPTARANTANWSVSSASIVTAADLGLAGEGAAPTYASFTFTAKDSSVYRIDYNLVLSVTGFVNEAVGNFDVIVRETSGTDNTTFTDKQSQFSIGKVTPTFYLDNFVATTTASPLVPATEFAKGDDIRLAWESNGTWFQVYEKNNATPIYSGSANSCTVKGGASTDTTYFLQASMTGDPADDSGGFEPIVLYDSLTVTISNPALTPSSVDCSGSLSGTALTVTGNTALANVTASGTLSVTDATTLNSVSAASLHVSGDVSARNGRPLLQQLVHKRPLYGIGGQQALSYVSTPHVFFHAYAPFKYAVPDVQEGATRKFRLYAVYTDYMRTAGSYTEVTFSPWANNTSPATATFTLPKTYGNSNAYRDAFSGWIEGTPMTGHAAVTLSAHSSESGYAKGILAYLEMEAWDFFD